MNATTQARGFLNYDEAKVLDALEGLPDEYKVTLESGLDYPSPSDDLRYHPDFVVSKVDGTKVFVEVKSPRSLSMSNLSRLKRIKAKIDGDKQRYLVMVLNDHASSTKLMDLPDFKELKVGFVKNKDDIIRKTLDEFSVLSKKIR